MPCLLVRSLSFAKSSSSTIIPVCTKTREYRLSFVPVEESTIKKIVRREAVSTLSDAASRQESMTTRDDCKLFDRQEKEGAFVTVVLCYITLLIILSKSCSRE